MNDQALDLRRALRIVWRHKIIVGIVAALGLCLGAGYAMTHKPMLSSSALVVLAPSTRDVPTQVVIAGSNPVLARALPEIKPAMTLVALQNVIDVSHPTPNIISIGAQASTAATAEATANAVASSYVHYVTSNHGAGQAVLAQARVLQPATSATGRSLPVALLMTGGLGLVAGALIGAIGVLAVNRGDRRLRTRDEIANAVGVPVLASIPASRPPDAGRWTKLLEGYEPGVVHGWQLRTALSYLGQSEAASGNGSNGKGLSIAVVTLAHDRAALALGPQLAVFAASLGVPTALVVGRQQDANATAALRAACAEPPPSSRRPAALRLGVTEQDRMPRAPGIRLTIVVTVVDGQSPDLAGTLRTTATVLGASAGAVTAAQLVSVAVSATTDGRQIDGILVADPDSADHTTGRIPQLARPPRRRMPTRLTSTPTQPRPTETRR
jgi:capsular polysaccharide biosynthesis protein